MNWNGFFVKKRDADGNLIATEFETTENETTIGIAENSQQVISETTEDMPENSPSEAAVASEEESPAEGPVSEEPVAEPAENSESEKKADAICEFDLHVRLNENGDVGRAALYLAMSEDIADEKHVKESLTLCGWKAVATEIGGISGNIPLKASRAIVGAALNSGVVRKTPSEMHALMHAAQEAFGHFIPEGLIECSVGAKIAIVRNSQWLAVAVSGDTAYHAVAHHERVGVGVMHI